MISGYRWFGAFRLLLAMVVVLSHTLFLTDFKGSFIDSVGIGNAAVMSFFVLSGFIISEAGATFYNGRPAAFLLNRVWRIVPPYWAALAISLLIHYAIVAFGTLSLPDYPVPPTDIFNTRNILSNVFSIFPRPGRMSIDVPAGFYPFVRYFWAINIEMAFYLVAFSAFALAAILGIHRVIYAGYVTAFLAAHLFHEYVFPIHWELQYAPYFILGVCFRAHIAGSRLATAGMALSAAAIAVHFYRYSGGKLEPHIVASCALLATLCLAAAYLAGVQHLNKRFKPLDKFLGDQSYPVYLNHYAVSVLASSVALPPSLAVPLAVTAATLLVSVFSVVLIEKPIRPMRDAIRRISIS